MEITWYGVVIVMDSKREFGEVRAPKVKGKAAN